MFIVIEDFLYRSLLALMVHFKLRRFFSLNRLEITKISSRKAVAKGVILPAEEEVRVPNVSSEASSTASEFPAICFREFSNVYVTANSRVSAIVHGDSFLIPEASPEGPLRIVLNNPKTGGLLSQDRESILVNRRHGHSIPAGIFAGSWSPGNWFHWVIDVLPAVALSGELPRKYDHFPLLLPEVVFSKPNFLEIATKVARGRQIRHLPSERYVSVERLVWIDGPSSPGPKGPENSQSGLYSLHRGALLFFRSAVLDAYGLSTELDRFRRIFVARKENTDRPYNQDELIETALGEGLEVVWLEELSVKESIRIFLEAKLVVGAHGAGWANGLFLGAGSRAVILMAEKFRQHNWFVNPLSAVNAKFEVILGSRLDLQKQDSFHIQPSELRRRLRN